MVLVVVAVQAVPAAGVEVLQRLQPAGNDADAVLVVFVVDRIGLRLPDDRAIDDAFLRREAQDASFL